MATLDQIDTIVVLMLENRSFDHMLGYLSLPGPAPMPVEGLSLSQDWLDRYANMANGTRFDPFALPVRRLPNDLPHTRAQIAPQIGTRDPMTGRWPMQGFAQAYADANGAMVGGKPPSMGYHTEVDVPVLDFLAHNYAVCDRWFAPLPTGTQPNRLMAMSGRTRIDDNVGLLPEQALVYDWLKEREVPWRVYHEGFPFFMLMPDWWGPTLFGPRFRPIRELAVDFADQTTEFPGVAFVEPMYTDAATNVPNDDHPPTSVTRGQELMRKVYRALVSNPARWERTVLIITYDEHGGFFDHVSPLPIPYQPGADAQGNFQRFESTGPRVPGLVVSPLVSPGSVFSRPLDHTSILRFLGEKFGAGKYSPEVTDRHAAGGLSSILDVLDRAQPRTDVLPPPNVNPGMPPVNNTTEAFRRAAEIMRKLHPEEAADKFPELWFSDEQ